MLDLKCTQLPLLQAVDYLLEMPHPTLHSLLLLTVRQQQIILRVLCHHELLPLQIQCVKQPVSEGDSR